VPHPTAFVVGTTLGKGADIAAWRNNATKAIKIASQTT